VHKFEYRLFLCKLDHTELLELNYTAIESSPFLTEFDELKFTIQGNEEGVLQVADQRFLLLNGMYIIKMEKFTNDTIDSSKYFIITECSLKYDGGIYSNDISCYAEEYMQFNRRYLRGYTAPSETLGEILDYICRETLYNTWSVGTIPINNNSSSGRHSYYGSGNINLHNRPIILDNGDYHTLYSFSFEEDGVEILIPQVRWGYDGIMSEQEAKDWYHSSSEYLAKFTYDPYNPDWAWQQADAYAIVIHNENALIYDSIAQGLSSSLYLDTNEYHTFNFQENSLTDVFKTLSTDFDVIFNFNNDTHVISAQKRILFTTIEGLLLSPDNFLNSIVHTPKYDQIITRLYAYGKDGLGISQYNITGQSYIDDFSYFISNNYFSSSLLSAWNVYSAKVASNAGTFSALIANLNLYQSATPGQLLYLQNELVNLNAQKVVYDNVMSAYQSANKKETTEYSAVYVSWTNNNIAIANKTAEIVAKEAEITAIGVSQAAIIADLAYTNPSNFSQSQLEELTKFILEDVVTLDSLEDASLLLQYAQTYIARKNEPIIEVDVDIADLYSIEEAYELRSKIVLGSYIYFDIPSIDWDYQTLQLVAYVHNPFENKLNMKFSNTNKIESDIYYLNDVFKKLNANAIKVTNNGANWGEYVLDKPTILTDTSEIDAEKNIIRAGPGNTIDHRGFTGTDIGSDPNSHLKLLDDKMIITRNDWQTFRTIMSSNGVHFTNAQNTSRIVIDPDYGIQIDQNVEALPLVNENWDNRFYADAEGNLYIEGNIFVGDSAENIVIDRYGLDPTYAIWFKNMLPNTDAQVAETPPIVDEATPFIPRMWIGALSSVSAIFRAGRSFKVAHLDTLKSMPEVGLGSSYCDPTTLPLITRGATPLQFPYMRFSWWSKYGSVQVAIKDETHDSYFSIVKEATPIITIGNYTEIFDRNENWVQKPDSIWFDPQETGHSGCVDIRVELTNVYSTNPSEFLYINAPMLTIDKTGKWAQAYISGPFSVATVEGASVEGGGIIGNLYVEIAMPANAPNKAVNIEYDNPTIDDGNTATSELTLTWASARQQRITGTSSVHLPDPSTDRNIQGDAVNHDGVVMFCIFNANEISGIIPIDVSGNGTLNYISTWYLYPQESLTIRTEPTTATKNWEVV
jgi:hypothetical protein